MFAVQLLQLCQWMMLTALLLLGFYGFGAEVGRRLQLPHGYHLILGFCVTLLLGGALTVFGVASFLSLLALVVVGCTLGWVRLKSHLPEKVRAQQWVGENRNLLLGCLAIFVAFTAEAFLLSGTAYNHHDDFHGYLVYPARLLQEGTFSFDPYNFRFSTGVLGAHSFFLAMGLVLGDFDFLKVFEFLVGVFFIGVLLVSHSHKKQGILGIGAMLLLFLVVPWSANLSSVWTSVALLLCMLQLILALHSEPGESTSGLFVALGLAAGTLLAMKTSNLPAVGLLLLLAIPQVKKAQHAAGGALGFLSVTMIWGWVHHQATGTFLYPFFGSGFVCEAYPAQFESMAQAVQAGVGIGGLLSTHPVFLSLLVLGMLCLRFATAQRGLYGLILLAALVVPMVILLKMGVPYEGRSGHLRHGLPLVVAVLLFFMVRIHLSALTNNLGKLALVSLCLLSAWLGWQKVTTFGLMWENGQNRTNIPYFQTQTGVAGALHMQQSIPPGEPLWVRSARPFHLDFARNPIWIADFPGLAGDVNCPVWPQSPQAFADYFQGQGIRYIAYSYLNEGGFPKEFFAKNLEHPQAFFRLNANKSLAFQRQLGDMMNAFAHHYNDGVYVVLDLQRRSSEGSQKAPPPRF